MGKVISLLFLACWAGGIAGVGEAQEPPKIVKIEFAGLKNLSERRVRDMITTKVGEPFNRDQLQQDLDALYQSGYFAADPSLTYREVPGGVEITFELVENPLIKEVRLQGNTVFPEQELSDLLVYLQPGKVANDNPDNLERDLARLRNHYQEAGYIAFVAFDTPPAVENPDGTISISILITEVRVGNIVFEGNTKTKDKVFRREMVTQPGSLFSWRQISEDQRRIFNLGLLEDIQFRGPVANPNDPSLVDLVFEVKERRTGMITAGAGYSSRYGLIGFADISENNFRGLAQQISLHIEFGGRRSYALSLYEPWLDRHHTSLGVNVYDTDMSLSSSFPGAAAGPVGQFTYRSRYDQRRQGFRLNLSRPLTPENHLSLGFKGETVETRRPLGGEALPALPPFPFQELGSDTTRSLTVSFIHDTRDFFMNPSRGARYSLNLEFAGGFLKGDNNFVKYGVDLRRYVPLKPHRTLGDRPKHVIAARLMVGFSRGQLPFSQVYFLGGADTLRGYDEDRFFGNRSFLFNLEYRRQVQQNVQAVAFLDAGRAWRAEERLDFPGSLVVGYGFGLRVDTPLGPLRLDFGFGSEGSQTHFGFAQQF